MITPREMLRDYMTVLNILMQNPEASFDDVVGSHVTLQTEEKDEESIPEKTEEHKRFTLDDIEF